MVLMKYHTLFFFRKLGKISQNLSSAAVVIGALSTKSYWLYHMLYCVDIVLVFCVTVVFAYSGLLGRTRRLPSDLPWTYAHVTNTLPGCP